MLTKHETALAYPCLLPEEVAHPRYFHVFPNATINLTVNTGYE